MYFKYDNYVDQYCQALLASDALDIFTTSVCRYVVTSIFSNIEVVYK